MYIFVYDMPAKNYILYVQRNWVRGKAFNIIKWKSYVQKAYFQKHNPPPPWVHSSVRAGMHIRCTPAHMYSQEFTFGAIRRTCTRRSSHTLRRTCTRRSSHSMHSGAHVLVGVHIPYTPAHMYSQEFTFHTLRRTCTHRSSHTVHSDAHVRAGVHIWCTLID